MATINLLPSSGKQAKPKRAEKKPSRAAAAAPTGIAAKIHIPVIPLYLPFLVVLPPLVAAWFFLGNQIQQKQKALSLLQDKANTINTANRKIGELNKVKKELTEQVNFYKGLYEDKVAWSEKLRMLKKILPPQIWLTSFAVEGRPPTRTVTIRGSATSLAEAEIITAITTFAGELKENDYFKKDFEDVRLGPLQSERRGNFSVMNFSLYCKLK